MVELIIVGIVAGFLAGISPCILPVLPVVLVAAARPPSAAGAPGPGTRLAGTGPAGAERAGAEPASAEPAGAAVRAGLARPVVVVAGLILSFSMLVLAGSEFLSLLHLPQDSLRAAGIALLILVGLGYLVPPLGDLLERPFARLSSRRPGGRAAASNVMCPATPARFRVQPPSATSSTRSPACGAPT